MVTSYATRTLWTVYNTFLCIKLSWCICYSLYFLSAVAEVCSRTGVAECKEGMQLWKKMPIFSSPVSHFRRFPFAISISSFLVLPVPHSHWILWRIFWACSDHWPHPLLTMPDTSYYNCTGLRLSSSIVLLLCMVSVCLSVCMCMFVDF